MPVLNVWGFDFGIMDWKGDGNCIDIIESARHLHKRLGKAALAFYTQHLVSLDSSSYFYFVLFLIA